MRVSVEDHLASILERVTPIATTDLPLRAARDAVLAERVRAPFPLPLWDNSAMDGYALRAIDVAAATEGDPVRLRVVGEVLAGSGADPAVAEREAVRIMTGAPLPTDADAVVRVEATVGDEPGSAWATAEVSLTAPVAPGSNVRARGADAAAGSVLAEAGDRLGAARIAALAAAGVERVRVQHAPRVAVVVTGSELRGPGEPIERGLIPESNSLLVTGLLRELGIEATEVRRYVDDAAVLAEWLREYGGHYDCIITTGGIGPGTHDIVRIVLEPEPRVRAARVAVRPGQLQVAGRLGGGAFVFALPGNPVSAAVSFELFVRPALLAMWGSARTSRLRVPAVAKTAWRGVPDRLQVLPVLISEGDGRLQCAPAVRPGEVSHSVGGHGASNGYALVPVGVGDVAAGDEVPVVLVSP